MATQDTLMDILSKESISEKLILEISNDAQKDSPEETLIESPSTDVGCSSEESFSESSLSEISVFIDDSCMAPAENIDGPQVRQLKDLTANDGTPQHKAPTEAELFSEKPTFTNEHYKLPNDPQEQTRLTHQSAALSELLHHKLWRVPLLSPQKILDVGCGTGAVTTALAATFPTSQIIGLDISPPVPNFTSPKNISYITGDFHTLYNQEHPDFAKESYDYIFSRFLVLGMKNWPSYVRACYALLKPGGYLELQDTVGMSIAHVNHGILPLEPWDEKCHIVAKELGMDYECGVHLEKYMREAGFEVMSKEEEMLPFGTWLAEEGRPETERMGRLMKVQGRGMARIYVRRTLEGVESEEVIGEYERMAGEQNIEEKGAYRPLYLVVGRKSL